MTTVQKPWWGSRIVVDARCELGTPYVCDCLAVKRERDYVGGVTALESALTDVGDRVMLTGRRWPAIAEMYKGSE